MTGSYISIRRLVRTNPQINSVSVLGDGVGDGPRAVRVRATDHAEGFIS